MLIFLSLFDVPGDLSSTMKFTCYLSRFRITAELQARRRLGLTATLIREDGRE